MSYRKLDEKLDKIDGRLDALTVNLAENTASLKEHMRRTELLENQVKPIEAHVHLMNNAAKVASVLLGAVLAAKSLGLF